MPDKNTVVVTGFGPFGEHEVNASWVAVQELAKMGLSNDVELLVCEIPVIYKDVKERVPLLWKKYDPVLVVHVGVSGIATELTLEQQAHNSGYDKPDVKLMVPSTACCISDGPDCMLSHINMSLVCEEVNQSDCCVKAVVSYNAGRYLCDFTYYTSLSQNCDCAAFIHVPPLGKPYAGNQLAQGLKIAILSMLKQVKGQGALNVLKQVQGQGS
ncbi:pyroglutamyl-peptidase 1-like [Amphiura filiformis]|uniref:pyroglutamyl-peptidase 1-like n=1 Tax=Amphiura filiformis TaxID=82378 RepID=UPI003B21886A